MRMKQKKMKLTSWDVKRMFETNLPHLLQLAHQCSGAEAFKQQLVSSLHLDADGALSEELQNIGRLVRHDGLVVHEASTGKEMRLETISKLWTFLSGMECPEAFHPDFLLDVYKQFEALNEPPVALPDKHQMARWMRRWAAGTDPHIMDARAENKRRIIEHLVQRIDTRHSEKSRYVFPHGADWEQKKAMVEAWWHDYRFHLLFAARSWRELNQLMGGTLPEEMKRIYQEAQRKGIPIFVTPYYLSLLDASGSGYDDFALRSYVFYSEELVNAFGSISAWEKEDVVEAGKPNAAGWLLPGGHNIHRRYPEVAILIPDTVGRACGGLCASCQRLYDFQSGRFNFDWEALLPKETWDMKLRRLMEYFRDDKQLRDILITGGDALMSRNTSLRKILEAVYVMARQKRLDNQQRPDGEKYAEIERVRLGTRMPVYLPMRIDDELLAILTEFRKKAMEVGISQFLIQTHFQTPLEITLEVCEAVRSLQAAGWTVTNQLVFNVAASRRGHTARLRRELNKIGVLGYYTFSVKGFEENHAVFAPNSRSVQEMVEEKRFGRLEPAEAKELLAKLRQQMPHSKSVSCFARMHGLPFLATDRSVMNLPGIGKSMSFHLVAVMPDGRRMLAFSHDRTRRHSPVIENMPIVYIQENKSIAAYLRQFCEIGEKYADYQSIWRYHSGETEPRFSLYEYTDSGQAVTAAYSHLAAE